jgi:hypothetical protein
MRRGVELLIVLACVALVVVLIADARGPRHHRGIEVGTHGTKIVIVHQVP